MAIRGRCIFVILVALGLLISCKTQKPVEQKKPAPLVIVKPKQVLLSPEQRAELAFPADMISPIELAAGSEAEPFYATVLMQSENLKGDKGFESRKLAGFSVRTRKSEELIDSFRAGLRAKGYLMFKSQRGYGKVPDIISVVKGRNSYDILKMLGTEAPNYHLDTKAIIAWLKSRQEDGAFVVTGVGSDWVETRFVKPPKNIPAFAKKVAAFAPDVLGRDIRTLEKLAERIEEKNGFYLVWD